MSMWSVVEIMGEKYEVIVTDPEDKEEYPTISEYISKRLTRQGLLFRQLINIFKEACEAVGLELELKKVED